MQPENDDKDEQFKRRISSIFGHLDELEKKHEDVVVGYDIYSNPKRSQVCQSDLYNNKIIGRNKENCKRRLPKQVPDHVLNPQKWQKYR